MRQFYRSFTFQPTTGNEFTMDEICPAENELTAQLLAQNSVLNARCGAVPLEILKEAIQLARRFIDLLMDVVFALMNMCMDIMQLMGNLSDQAKKAVLDNLFYWFMQMLIAMGEVILPVPVQQFFTHLTTFSKTGHEDPGDHHLQAPV